VISLPTVATACSAYLREAREFRALDNPTPALCKEFETGVEEMRQIARDLLVEFAVLDPELVRFAVLNREGLDTTISRLCAPLNP